MTKTLAGVLGAAALAAALAACADGPLAAGDGSCAAPLAAAAQVIDSVVAAKGIPGGYVLVMQGDRVVCSHAAGVSSTGNHVQIASASKWLTAIAILTLVDEGKLKLDEPISAKLPEFTGQKGQITLRQLLSHTSGIPTNQLCLGDRNGSLKECTTDISFSPLDYAPGTQFRYGGSSFQVAGRLAEIAAGEPWNDLFKHRVTDPLELQFTGWFGTNPLLAGGGWSTGQEYARILQMVANGGTWNGHRILSDSALAMMAHDNVGAAPMTDTPRIDSFGYGLGVWRDAVDAHGAATQISSPGASGFYPWADMKRGIVGIVWLPAYSLDGYWFSGTQKIQAIVRTAADAGQL